jgi:hypothetical protein
VKPYIELDALIVLTAPAGNRRASRPAIPARPPLEQSSGTSIARSVTFEQGVPIAREHDGPATERGRADLVDVVPVDVDPFESEDESELRVRYAAQLAAVERNLQELAVRIRYGTQGEGGDAMLSAARQRVATLLPMSDEELARDVAAMGADGQLLHFQPAELILSAAEAGRVIEWLWPDVKPDLLGGIGDVDCSFAQALLVEAIDASADTKIVEELYAETYMKVFRTFGDVWEVMKALGRTAFEEGWFTRAKGRVTRENVAHLTIYENVRQSFARRFRGEITRRVATGAYGGY